MPEKLLHIILFVFLSLSATAQFPDINFTSYNAEQGFHYTNINDICNDKWGRIILATDEGLVSFDGKKFQPYVLPADTSVKQPLQLEKLFRDRDNNLWMCTRKGIYFYDCNNFKTSFYTHIKNDTTSIINPMVTSVYQDRSGNMWFGNWDGISRFNKENGTYTNFRLHNPIDSLHGNCVSAITEDKDGSFWLGTWRGIMHFNPANGKTKHYYNKKLFTLENLNENVKAVFFDRSGRLWTGSWGCGLRKYNPITDEFEIVLFPHDTTFNQVSDIIEDEKGLLWIATDAALICYNPSNGQYKIYRNNDSNQLSYSSYPVTSLYLDNNQGLWIGTLLRSGLYYFNARQRQTTVHVLPDAYNLGNRNYRTTYFHEDPQEKLFVGNEAAIFARNPGTDAYNAFKLPRGFKFIDSLNRFWSAPDSCILISAPNNPGVIIHTIKLEDEKTRNFNNAVKFGFDRHKKIWMLYKNNLYNFDSNFSMKLAITGNRLGCIDFNPLITFFFTRDNRLIFQNKLQFAGIFNFSDSSLLTFKKNIPAIRTFFEDNKGNIWLTADKQVFFLAHSKPVLFKYKFRDYLNGFIYDIVQDKRGYMWVLNDIGLLRFRFGTDSILVVNHKYGMPERRPAGVLFLNREGKLFIGYRNIFITLAADSINCTQRPQTVLITDVNLYNKSIFKKYYGNQSSESIREIKLNHDENVLNFAFILPDFLNPEWVRYKYILEGIDKEWTTGSAARAHYNHLPSGNYVFKVFGCNSEGIWTSEPATLSIIINPPFWGTWWFRSIMILIFFFLIISWQRIREQNLQNQKEKLEKEVKERTAKIMTQKEEIEAQSELLRQNNEELELLNITKDKFFSIIAHDLKNPFNAISGLSDTLIRDLTKLRPDEAYEFLYTMKTSSDSAASLLDNLLQWARSQTNSISINPSSFSLRNLIENTFRLLKVIAASKNITLTNNIETGTSIYADENMIMTVVRNIIGNAIKFTPQNGSISISSTNSELSVIIHIADTGTGMEKEQVNNLFRIDQKTSSKGTEGEKGTGLGLIICKDFIDKNNGLISVESEPGKGTRFSITLPAGSAKTSTDVLAGDTPADNSYYPPKMPKEKQTVLIAEDNDELRMALIKELEYFFIIVSAENGATGLEKALEVMPDLIVSDWMMPVMDGLEFCKKIKTDVRTNHIPFILLTAKSAVEEKIEGFDTGADEYLTKPFNSRLLLSRIYNLIDSRKKLRGQFVKQFLVNPSASDIKPGDREFIEKAVKVVEKHMENCEFDVPLFASELSFSRSQLHKKLIAITNQSATEFIRTIRLKEAARLLTEQDLNISEVFPKVGFNDRSYFTRSFTELFGMNPSDYKKK